MGTKKSGQILSDRTIDMAVKLGVLLFIALYLSCILILRKGGGLLGRCIIFFTFYNVEIDNNCTQKSPAYKAQPGA